MAYIYANACFDDLELDLDFDKVCKACLSCSRPDMTFMVDWALKNNYLSILFSLAQEWTLTGGC